MREMSGFRGCGWDPFALPEKFDRLYRKATITHVKSHYYADGFGGYTFWKDYTFTIVVEWNSDCSQIINFSATGSLNGLIKSYTLCPETSFTMDYDDFVTETDPGGNAGANDLPFWPGFYPSGGSDTSEIVSVSEDEIVYRYIANDGSNDLAKLVTTIEMEDVLDTSTIRDIVSGMLATVPLTKGAPVAISGIQPDNTPVTSTWGFPTKGAGFNHAYVLYDVTDCCSGEVVTILNAISSDDDRCQCSLHYSAPDRPLWVYRDRRQSYMPAAFAVSIPGSSGGGAGALYSTGSTASVIYGWSFRWVFNAGLGEFELQDQRDTATLDTYDCAAWGKKALLSRPDPDEWTVLQYGDTPTNECMDPTPTTKCYRFYYPTDADTAVDSSDSTVRVIDEGVIYRAIPELTEDMEADCPFPEDGEVSCPTGGDGSDVGIDPNPCL